MIKITIDPQDLIPLFTVFFTASHEGKSQNNTFNRVYTELDKQVRKQYGVAYINFIENLRKQVEKQRKETP